MSLPRVETDMCHYCGGMQPVETRYFCGGIKWVCKTCGQTTDEMYDDADDDDEADLWGETEQ